MWHLSLHALCQLPSAGLAAEIGIVGWRSDRQACRSGKAHEKLPGEE
jgi:hypothetical protein